MNVLLQTLIKLVLESSRSDAEEREKEDPKERIRRGVSPDDWRSNEDEAFEDRVEAMMDEPEYSDVDAFVAHKLDNDEYSFDAAELQALARNAESEKIGKRATMASPSTTSVIKKLLTSDYGFVFTPRAAVKYVRGSMSSAHGKHPFAGSGGGGSGFDPGFMGSGGWSAPGFGGGAGAIGSGQAWNKDDPKNLAMGAKKKR